MDLTKYLTLINNCDTNEPLLSESELGTKLEQISLERVTNDLAKFYQALDVEQLIRTDRGIPRDYRGLGELMEFNSNEIESRFKRSYRPTKSMIDTYINENSIRNQVVTVKDLLKMLETIERFDVVDDLTPTLVEIVQKNLSLQGIIHPRDARNGFQESQQNQNLVINEQLTVDDFSNERIKYDAFICFAPEDYEYAQELISLLEKNGKRVATADDLLPGHFEHDALVQLIDRRCLKVLTVLTPSFLRSKECELQTKFASELALKSGKSSPKIIPVLFEPCDNSKLPYMIQVISKIDMTNRVACKWQLKKLLKSLDHRAYELPAIDQLNPLIYTERNTSLHNRSIEVGPIMPTESQSAQNPTSSEIIIESQRFNSCEPIIDLASSHCSETNDSYKLSVATVSPNLNSSASTRVHKQVSNWLRRRMLGGFHVNNCQTSRRAAVPSSPSPSLSSVSSISPSISSQAVLIKPAQLTRKTLPNSRLDDGQD